MRDKVTLQINDQRIEKFISYRVESNLFNAADTFDLTLADPAQTVEEGSRCKLYVNDQLELNGIIDRIIENTTKTENSLKIEGRDLMGLLVDSYAEDFADKKGETLKVLAQRLLAGIPFINRKAIQYGKGSKDRAVPLTGKEEDFEFTEIEPAQTVFEILKKYALSRGMLFFSLPDGTINFGEPVTSGKAEYTLILRKDGKFNNVLSAQRIRDISRRYKTATITGQRQGTDEYGAEDINISATVTDETFPFAKPFVATADHDGQNPARYAKVLMEKQQLAGQSLSYKTYGHSQNGKNYQVNTVCHVSDDCSSRTIENDFLIYARTFEMSKQGVFTNLKISRLGVLPV
jgi:prophage tail gpP-like protein